MHKIAALTETGVNETRNWEELMFQGTREVFEMMIAVSLRRCAEGKAVGTQGSRQ